MRKLLDGPAIPAAVAAAAMVSLVVWLNIGSLETLHARVPGLDRGPGAASKVPVAPLVGKLTNGDGVPSDVPGAWPRFRGDQFDGVGHEEVPLARQWPPRGPAVLWSIDLGEGYAGAAVWKGRVYVLDYDREASADALRCFSLDDAREIWRFSYPVAIKRNHGMSRTVPAITDNYLVSFGPMCHLACLNPATGQSLWLFDLVAQFGAAVPQWYAGQCPLVDGDRAIVAPGGDDALLVALDAKTGHVLWKTPNPRRWKMTHVSIMPMELDGQKTYVYCGKGGVVGVSAADGSVLWDTTDWKISIATCPSPVILPGNRIFCCGGYNSGAAMLQVAKEGGKYQAKTLFRLDPGRFGSTQHTPVFYKDHLFGVREKDKELVCFDLEGKEVWHSGAQHRFGAGPYLIADGLIYVLDDSGKLTMAEATAEGYRQLGEFQAINGHDAWGPMALVHGRLILRDFNRMVCLDVAKK